MPCKKAQSSYNSSVVEVEERMSVAEMNLVMNRLGMEGINENSSVRGGGGAEGVFEEEEPSLDEIKETFRVFDANNDGFIDGSDLHRIISNLGFKEMYDLEDYKRMIKAFDGDGDGLIDFPDFIKLMEKCLC
ncbi:hypothetical protein C2S52_022634 [Perilla frutescens var. hirtella]|nr:hypothetical protein C2S52_022634 [Perilla frutescens var. hirtella]